MYFLRCYPMVILWVCYGYPMVLTVNYPTTTTNKLRTATNRFSTPTFKKSLFGAFFFAYIRKKYYLCSRFYYA